MILLALVATLLVVAIVFLLVIFIALRHFNEETQKTCGKCDFCDTSLNHCWLRGISVGTEDEACVTFLNREE